MESTSRGVRGLLVGGGLLLWLLGLVWVLHRKGIVTAPVFSPVPVTAEADEPVEVGTVPPPHVSEELVVEASPEQQRAEARARAAAAAAAAAAVEAETPIEPVEDPGPPTYPVWFESERSIGVCKINYEGGSRTANLHVATRLPEGRLSFSYQCGKHAGHGSIDVKTKRVNGVLFCDDKGSVSVKVVRSKDGRCGRR